VNSTEIESEEEDTPINPLVDSLFDEVERLRKRLHDSEERASRIEMEVREEVTKDMAAQMQAMEQSYARRLRSEVDIPSANHRESD
jgi:kinesin family member 20